MPSKVPPPGVYVPVPTFFVPRSSPLYNTTNPPLDLETQARHAIFLARAGIKGLLLLGSSGEAVALTNEERHAMVSYVRQKLTAAGFEGYPLMAGTATQGIDDTVTQLAEARAAGADWGMCLAPNYFAAQGGDKGVAAWYEAVAERSPMPVLIYHYPGVSNGIAIAPAAFERMAAHPNIVGCKLSHANLSHTGQIAMACKADGAAFATFTGLGQQLLPALAVGGAGAIDALAGVFPHTVVAIHDLYFAPAESRDGERWRIMQRLQADVARAEELVVRHGTVGVKAACSRYAGFGDPDGTRLPLLGGLSEDEWKDFAPALDVLRETERQLAEGSDAAWNLR